MPREIHLKDYPILLALIKNPMGTAKEITDEANKVLDNQNGGTIKLNENTVARRLKKLQESGTIGGAMASLNHERLGLQLFFFLIHLHGDDWEMNAQTVIQFCDSHPYTAFRDRVFGGSFSGIMAYFMLPADSEALGLLLQCFEILKERKIISNYARYQIKSRYNNGANLSKFDMSSNHWEIDYKEIRKTLDKKAVMIGSTESQDSVLPKLDPFDMALMREMTRDSRRPQKQILEEIMDEKSDVGGDYTREFRQHFRDTPQTISRRLKELENLNIFDGFQLIYPTKEFGMFNRALYIADYDEDRTNSLIKAMDDGEIPFPARVGISNDKVIFWMNLPPNVMPKLTSILMGHFRNLQFHLFGDDRLGYYFWHENYNIENKTWKVSKEWIIDIPIKDLDNKMAQKRKESYNSDGDVKG